MNKFNTWNYNVPFVWSLLYGTVSITSTTPTETPLNHNYQPDFKDSFKAGSGSSAPNDSMVACGICNNSTN